MTRWIALGWMCSLSAWATATENPESTSEVVSETAVEAGPLTDLVRLDGTPLGSDVLAGKVVLFVNVASRCGFTPQYEGLQELYKEFREQGLVVVGVPCNQFAAQEPGSAETIASFCQVNYGVEFPILEKQKVNGDKRSPLYRYLVTSSVGGGKAVRWNFEKFLVGRDGEVLSRYPSKVTPEDAELRAEIVAALAK